MGDVCWDEMRCAGGNAGSSDGWRGEKALQGSRIVISVPSQLTTPHGGSGGDEGCETQRNNTNVAIEEKGAGREGQEVGRAG